MSKIEEEEGRKCKLGESPKANIDTRQTRRVSRNTVFQQHKNSLVRSSMGKAGTTTATAKIVIPKPLVLSENEDERSCEDIFSSINRNTILTRHTDSEQESRNITSFTLEEDCDNMLLPPMNVNKTFSNTLISPHIPPLTSKRENICLHSTRTTSAYKQYLNQMLPKQINQKIKLKQHSFQIGNIRAKSQGPGRVQKKHTAPNITKHSIPTAHKFSIYILYIIQYIIAQILENKYIQCFTRSVKEESQKIKFEMKPKPKFPLSHQYKSFELDKFPTLENYLSSKYKKESSLELNLTDLSQSINNSVNPRSLSSTNKYTKPLLDGKFDNMVPLKNKLFIKNLAQFNKNKTITSIKNIKSLRNSMLVNNKILTKIRVNHSNSSLTRSGSHSHSKRAKGGGILIQSNTPKKIPINRSFVQYSENNIKNKSKGFRNKSEMDAVKLSQEERILNLPDFHPNKIRKKIVFSKNNKFSELIRRKFQEKQEQNSEMFEAMSNLEQINSLQLSYKTLKLRNRIFLNDLRNSDAKKFLVRTKYGIRVPNYNEGSPNPQESVQKQRLKVIYNKSIHNSISPRNRHYLKGEAATMEQTVDGNVSEGQICGLDLSGRNIFSSKQKHRIKAMLNNSYKERKASILAPSFPLYNQKMVDSIKKAI